MIVQPKGAEKGLTFEEYNEKDSCCGNRVEFDDTMRVLWGSSRRGFGGGV